MPYVSRLDELRPLAEVGGKAFHLQRTLAARLPVPDGIVVCDEAFQAFLEHKGLLPKNEKLLAENSLAIRELILAAEVPAPIRDEIAAALPQFHAVEFVAVRS